MFNDKFKNIKAVIFDMDGVLIDSEVVMAKAAAKVFNKYGIPAKAEDFAQFCGMGEICYFGGVAGLYNTEYTEEIKDESYQEYYKIVEQEAYVYPCVVPTLEKLKDDKIPTAVASSAEKPKVYANLHAILKEKKVEDYFYDVVTSNDVTRNKPNPDVFLKAAEKIHMDPRDCLIFEDSLSGVRAAKAAGATCCGLTTAHTKEELLEVGADMVATGIDAVYDPGKIL